MTAENNLFSVSLTCALLMSRPAAGRHGGCSQGPKTRYAISELEINPTRCDAEEPSLARIPLQASLAKHR